MSHGENILKTIMGIQRLLNLSKLVSLNKFPFKATVLSHFCILSPSPPHLSDERATVRKIQFFGIIANS